MSVETEYEVALEYLQKKHTGEIVLTELSTIAKKIDVSLRSCEILKDNSMVQTALSLISEETSTEVLEKNLVLFAYRLLVLGKHFDSLSLFEKIAVVFDIVNILQEEQGQWLCEYEEKLHPIHDKNERRKRRQEFFEASGEERRLVTEDSMHFTKNFLQYFAPQGIDSIVLPSFARMFIPKNYLQDNLKKVASFCDSVIGNRAWKETILFYVMTFLFHEKSSAIHSKSQEKIHCEFPNEILEKAIKPCTYVLHLLGEIEPSIRFLPKEEQSQKALCFLSNFFEKFSLEELFLSLIPFFSIHKQLVTTQKLEDLIDAASGSPKAISYLLKKVIRYKQSEIKTSIKSSFKDLILIGVQEAMIDSVVKEKSDELVYKEVPLKIMQYTHWFIVSPAFDRFLYKIFDSCFFKLVIKK